MKDVVVIPWDASVLLCENGFYHDDRDCDFLSEPIRKMERWDAEQEKIGGGEYEYTSVACPSCFGDNIQPTNNNE